MKLSRLSGRKICSNVQRKGRMWKGQAMMIKVLPGAPKSPSIDPAKNALYVGVMASAKLSKLATERNKMRRRCREALRIAVQERKSLPTMQLLITPRSASLKAPFSVLQEDIEAFLSTMRS